MHFTQSLLALLAASSAVAAQSTVYLIRHGEKPDSGNGLSAQGMQRAQCLRNVFGAKSQYNIGKIMAQQYTSDGKRKRPYDTVLPLAKDLGIPVDTPCDRDDPDCVANVIDNYTGPGNVLLAWEHKALSDIVTALGDSDAPDYPSDRFDLIWTDPYPYTDITSEVSEMCPGLDN